MDTIAIELNLEPQQYEQLNAYAAARQLSVAEAAQAAIEEWLAAEARLEKARAVMRQLGQGLGEGPSSNEIAKQHDEFLYGSKRG